MSPVVSAPCTDSFLKTHTISQTTSCLFCYQLFVLLSVVCFVISCLFCFAQKLVIVKCVCLEYRKGKSLSHSAVYLVEHV